MLLGQVCMDLRMADVAELEGAGECLQAGISSTLNPTNVRAAVGVTSGLPPGGPILTDPQTTGGLVAGVPEPQAAACVAEPKTTTNQQVCKHCHIYLLHAGQTGSVLSIAFTLCTTSCCQ